MIDCGICDFLYVLQTLFPFQSILNWTPWAVGFLKNYLIIKMNRSHVKKNENKRMAVWEWSGQDPDPAGSESGSTSPSGLWVCRRFIWTGNKCNDPKSGLRDFLRNQKKWLDFIEIIWWECGSSRITIKITLGVVGLPEIYLDRYWICVYQNVVNAAALR